MTLPWRADQMRAATSSANGLALSYIYSRDNEAEALQAKVLTNDEVRRIAVNAARLPELLGKADRAKLQVLLTRRRLMLCRFL